MLLSKILETKTFANKHKLKLKFKTDVTSSNIAYPAFNCVFKKK